MRAVRWCLLCSILLFVYAVPGPRAHAQSLRIDTTFNISIRFDAGPSFHEADIHTVSGLTPLPADVAPYGSATGVSTGFGLAWDTRIDTSDLLWGFSLAWRDHSVELKTEEPTTFTDINGGPIPGLIQHNLELSYRQLALRPELFFRVAPALHLRTGISLDLTLGSTASQSQTIVFPENRRFEESGTNQLTVDSRDIPDLRGVQLEFMVGASYDFPIDDLHAFVARPYAEMSRPLFAPAASMNWNFTDIRAGLEIVWSPNAPKFDIRDTTIIRDTSVRLTPDVADQQTLLISSRGLDSVSEDYSTRYTHTTITKEYLRMLPQPHPLINSNIEARFVLSDGRLAESALVNIEEVIENNVINLLPYIFFDQQSGELPDKYQQLIPDEGQVFSVSALPKRSTLEVYYNLLNIVGYRLQKAPAAKLVLTSCNDDPGTVRQKRSLAQQRAARIVGYLEHVWGIDRNRIRTNVKRLPSTPSPASSAVGRDENRRVEFSSDDSSILAPIIVRDTTKNADPSVIRFLPDVITEAGLATWQIDLVSAATGKKIHTIRGQNSIPEFIDWDFNNNSEVLQPGATALKYQLIIEDYLGTRDSSAVEDLLFEQIHPDDEEFADVTVNRYSLMSFDYNLFTLTDYHRRILQLVHAAATQSSNIRILGSTDVIGDEAYNLQLSRKRAETIADTLNLPAIQVSGIGEDPVTFPNDLPEGRFYSRRVDIVLRDEKNSPK